MPKLPITRWDTGATIYEAEAADLLTLVQMAAKDCAYLKGADLEGTNLDPRLYPVVQIGGSRDWITMLGAGNVLIGYRRHPLTWWLDNYAAVARKEGYSEAQVEEYKSYLDLLALRADVHASTEGAVNA